MIHISKRGEISRGKALAIRLLGLLVGVLLCAVITVVTTKTNPLEVFAAIVKGSFGSTRKTWIFFQNTAILLLISLAVTPAFRMRCWNLGAEGQVLAGAMAATACMVLLEGKLPNAAAIAAMLLASMAVGAIWAGIPAFFKARFNTNETLFTLMMNYVAMQIVNFFCVVWENPKGSGQMGIINQKTQFGWVPQLVNRYLLVIVVAAVLTVFLYFYLNYTKHGFELTVVGESERTARYVGIKVDGLPARRQHQPQRVFGHRRRPGLYRGHGLVAGQVRPDPDGALLRHADLPRHRREGDRDEHRPQHELRRYADRRPHFLHHRLRFLCQLQAQRQQEEQGG